MSVQDQEWKTMIIVARPDSGMPATFFTGREKAPVSMLTERKMHLLVVVLAIAHGSRAWAINKACIARGAVCSRYNHLRAETS